MTNLLAVAVFLLMIVTVVALLERAHRFDDRPHAPLGAAAEVDPDLRRVLHDLAARP